MRWLLIGLLISVGALLYVAVAATRHVLRQRRAQAGRTTDQGTGQETPDAVEVAGTLEDEIPKDKILKDKDAAGRGSDQT